MGFPTVFVRLTGCPLRCQYCDTAYAFTGGEWWTLEGILARGGGAGSAPCRASPAASRWRSATACHCWHGLCDAGYEVSLETSGALPVNEVDPRVRRVVDVKTPASGESSAQPAGPVARAQRSRPDQVRDLRPRATTSGVAPWCARAHARQRGHGAVFAQPRPAAGAASWPTGSSRIACRCACSCNCTRCSGARRGR